MRLPHGSATTETLLALTVLTPMLIGLPLLGKQLDLQHKGLEAARYAAWETTVWTSVPGANHKSTGSIALEARDRILGNPSSGIVDRTELESEGVATNPFWKDVRGRSLLSPGDSLEVAAQQSAGSYGGRLQQAIAHGEGRIEVLDRAMRLSDLGLNPRGPQEISVRVRMRSALVGRAGADSAPAELDGQSRAAILSDTWSARSEGQFRGHVDGVVADEMLEDLELPGRAIGMQALGPGRPLYGEGQFGWEPNVLPRTRVLPAAYTFERPRQ